ncbi:BREX-2 system adenine-specific DNA-methyltransferase PglX [Leucobacter sp. W1153]|uniref:BREX-2 system adenine-specific DNA-methyltransferase PglX n=1 Tax=Leucobacter sp. W1153 TaxID=3439064 RepID=UPI003F3D95FE
MIDSALLLSDLKRELKVIEADLRVRAENANDRWGVRLREEHAQAQRRDRTGLAWIAWRDGEVSQAAVAWIIATVFIRFAEDNDLLRGAKKSGQPVPLPWIAAPGDGLERAVENEQAFYALTPTSTSRHWLQEAFRTLADLPAGRPLVDPDHSAVWQAPISAEAADALLRFFRRTTPGGELVHDFHDVDLDTRFLGDLYQDLSDYAKKTFALLQTPNFVEEFILDHTLTPAIAEFGLTGLKLIDPACGSGHFLLGAFDRLVAQWQQAAPAEDRGAHVQKALDSIHGVDLNPFAVAIARFRLTVAALKAAGLKSFVGAPAFKYHLAIGDSLLGSVNPVAALDLGDGEYFAYDSEDLREFAGILEPGQYHVVVANPPYITVKDKALNRRYRNLYSTCSGTYALSVPFTELLFRLAKRPNGGGAGFVGQITSNSFMKREFGKKLIERFLSGAYTGLTPDRVDLTHIIDTSGAYIPGHGTPTVILIGRPRRPQSNAVRVVLGVRGEPSRPDNPAEGLVWVDMVRHVDQSGHEGTYVSVADVSRARFAHFPWSLSGGGAAEVKRQVESASVGELSGLLDGAIGGAIRAGADDIFIRPRMNSALENVASCSKPFVQGESLRDWTNSGTSRILFPYDSDLAAGESLDGVLWRWRTLLAKRSTFQGFMADAGLRWSEYMQFTRWSVRAPILITYAEIATHNHFVLERGGKVFKQTAPVIRLSDEATEDDYYKLLGVLNSSTACFWLKQVSHNKGDSTDRHGARVTGDPAFDTYQFNATKLHSFPMPQLTALHLSRVLEKLALQRARVSPASMLANDSPASLSGAHTEWERLGREMVALQEELDWRMYVAYGLADPELAPELPEVLGIDPNQRAFEIRLARAVAEGEATTAWFERHSRGPLTELSGHWPDWYRDLVERRLTAMETNESLRLLEQPEYKRRWAGAGWETLLASAVADVLLDRLEASELWRDASGRPLVRSAAQIADELRHDERFRELLTIHTGTRDFDLTTEVAKLLGGEAVPAFAPLRYKPSGVEKFRAWEHTWELQRAEDRGERVDVPVPPKYKPTDFLKAGYWTARGKLDVPKERFIALPGSFLPEDNTELFGWAGWDHGERGLAIARLANDLTRAGSADAQVIPLLGALIELEPWLKQWHDELDARSGVSPAHAIAGLITTLLSRLGLGRDAIADWQPPTPTRGRKRAS